MHLSLILSSSLKSKCKKDSTIPMNYGMTGKDVAEKMLRESGITDVQVISVEGELTDHYNPMNKTVNLSRGVYFGNHVAAGAVAAHECGHAIQHAEAYTWLKMRSAMVPIQNISSTVMNAIFLIMMFGSFIIHGLFPI